MRQLISGIAGILSTAGGFVCFWLTWPMFLILLIVKALSWMGAIQSSVEWFGWPTTPAVITSPIYTLMFGGIMIASGIILLAIADN